MSVHDPGDEREATHADMNALIRQRATRGPAPEEVAPEPAPHVPDFDAGARPAIVPVQSSNGSMNDRLRADKIGLADVRHLPERSP